jgi:hypothetical protein
VKVFLRQAFGRDFVSLGSQNEPNRVSQLGFSAARLAFSGLMPELAMLKPGVGSAGDA